MDKDKSNALNRLCDLGVMHLEKKVVSSPNLEKLLARHAQIETASGLLDAFAPKKGGKAAAAPKVEGDLANRIVSLSDRRRTLQDYIFSHQREQVRFGKWGDFDPKDFAYLAQNGVNAFLYELSLDTYEETVGNVPVIVLARDKKNNVIRLLAFDKIAGKFPYPLPDRALSVVEERDVFRKVEVTKIEEELTSLFPLKSQLEEQKKSVLADIEFEAAHAGMEKIADPKAASGNSSDLSVSWISGYVPAPDLGALKREASENSWALCADDPAQEDDVPTKLQNSSFTKLIYPLTGFLEMTPGYREKDISLWFLVFFTLFFAMIFGDAAYGTILLLITFIGIAKTAKKGVPLILKFLLLMSVANVVWGTLVCSWFALDIAKLPQILQNISLPLIAGVSGEPGWLESYNAGNFWIQSGLVTGYTDIGTLAKTIDSNLMIFCFSIAVVQLGVAHILKVFDYIRSPKALAEIGKLGMMVGLYYVILSLVVFGKGFGGVEPWQLYLIVIGFALNFIFGYYEGNLLKAIVASCTNIISVVLSITNIFSDIMSYIRLWAVGLASASIAGIINSAAGPMMGRLTLFVFGLLFFAFGHGFNMVLNVLSVLVHGVRLNTLEFSSHVGLTWSGFAFKPFAKRKK